MKTGALTPMSNQTAAPPTAALPAPRPIACALWRILGMTSVCIGLINAFIPLLPTTVFLLIGVWAYGKGDAALRQRLLQHPRYGRSLTLWIEHRQISRRGKIASCGGITLSMAISLAMIGLHKPIAWAIAAGLILLCLYLASRPEPRQD